jgi:hypothetical protein
MRNKPQMSPFVQLAAFLVVLGAALSTKSTDTIKRIAAERSYLLAVKERGMDENDEARALAGIYLFAARQLGEILEYVGDDQLRYEFYSGMKKQLSDWADILSPPGEPEGGYPEGPNLATVHSLDAYRARRKG